MIYSIITVHQKLMHVKQLEPILVLNYVLQFHSILKKVLSNQRPRERPNMGGGGIRKYFTELVENSKNLPTFQLLGAGEGISPTFATPVFNISQRKLEVS
jgi:hypothetical protein